jgi:hypothetical protein
MVYSTDIEGHSRSSIIATWEAFGPSEQEMIGKNLHELELFEGHHTKSGERRSARHLTAEQRPVKSLYR